MVWQHRLVHAVALMLLLVSACGRVGFPSKGESDATDGGADSTADASLPAHCANAVADTAQGETDVDCGGPCRPCALGKACEVPSDCAGNLCRSNLCSLLSCFNGQLDGNESDEDCGGTCGPCALGKACDGKSDCVEGECDTGKCVPASCADGKMNQSETDTDCGGADCAPCVATKKCTAPTDCASGVCDNQVCAAPTCEDKVINGDESDEDCGGSSCDKCADDKNCNAPADCLGMICNQGKCASDKCIDGMQNNGELYVDSGGPCTIRVPGCDETPDPWTVALYRFDDLPNATDATASHPGSFVGVPVTGTSETGCGSGFQGNNEAYVTIAASNDWKLQSGSVDLLVKMPDLSSANEFVGLVSRDAQGDVDGHFLIAISPDNRITARFQKSTLDAFRCSAPIPPGTWVRVGANWGSPNFDLWVNGVKASHQGPIPFYLNSLENCDTAAFVEGLDGIDLPWVIGASQVYGQIGEAIPGDAVIDEVRISDERRDFTRLP